MTSGSSFDESQWLVHIRCTLEEELEEEDIPVSIFNVPKSLMSSKPDFYIPQQVAIGPYHHLRPELFEMERYKVAATKRYQRRLQRFKCQHIVDELTKLTPRIRGCYHKNIDLKGKTLAWMLVVDVSFMLEYLQIYAVKEGKCLRRISSSMSHLVDSAGKKSSHNAILRDIVMLENQIPFFVLRKVLESEYSSLDLADEMLTSMLLGLCHELSPFGMVEFQSIKLSEIAHLLDLLYRIIVPRSELTSEIHEEEDGKMEGIEEEESLSKIGAVKQVFNEIWSLLGKLNKGPVPYIKRVLVSKPLELVSKMPWSVLTKLPRFSIIKPLFSSQNKDGDKSEDATDKPPLIEEIKVPSVTELSKSGVRFLPCNGTINTISFDTTTVTLSIPTVSLDFNSEVLLRNLVAYETSTASGGLYFTRYTELQNGIIDTEEDVKFLREAGIVFNYLKSDKEAANLCNGMSTSVRLTKVASLDKIIADLNKYYSGRWKIKVRNFIRNYVFSSWKFLTLFATILMLLLTTLQAFCSVYNCARILHIDPDLIVSNEKW